jgi:Family of unknown function (DUF6275)
MEIVTAHTYTDACNGFHPVNRQCNLPVQEVARNIVLGFAIDHLDKTDNVKLSIDDVYVVWFSKTLQNWKALLSTTHPDGMYYEVTCNGDKNEAYLDAYKKFYNGSISLD